LSKQARRSKSFLAAEAIAAYVESEEWQLGEILAGISELDSGKTAGHEKVSNWLRRMNGPVRRRPGSAIGKKAKRMKTQHEILMEAPEFRRLLSVEAVVAEASELIARLVAEQNVSKAGLARRLNKSRAWVTQLLSGKANMTVRTLAEVACALDAEVKLNAQPPGWKIAGKIGPIP
jgi:predicted transcriptional regulator/antitoxin component HigA of HigAB toxin-antitoxin module